MDTFKKNSNTFFEFKRLQNGSSEQGGDVRTNLVNRYTEFLTEFYRKNLPLEFTVLGHFNRFSGRVDDRTVVDVTPLTRFQCRKVCPTIFYNGDMSICPQDAEGDLIIGNVNDSELYELWLSDKATELKERVFTSPESIDICRECKEWYYPY